MNIYYIELFILLICLIILFWKFKKKKSEKINNNSWLLKSEDINLNPIRNQEFKPNEVTIQNYLGEEKYKLYQLLKTKLQNLGNPLLLWRGRENGWVLTLEESRGNNGLIVLTKNDLIGKIGLTRNQLFGIRTDTRFAKTFTSELPLFSLNDFNFVSGYHFFEIPLISEEYVISFIKLIKLSNYYDNYK